MKTFDKTTLNTINDLLQLEKAAKIICLRYENTIKNYDGSIINNAEYAKFKKFNEFRNEIINELEKEINKEIDG